MARTIPVSVRLLLALVALAAAGTMLLMLPASSSGQPLTVMQAAFTAVSALSGTGLSVITPGSDLSVFGKVVLALLIEIGGVGYLVLAVVVLRLLGRQISIADRVALQDTLGVLRPVGILQLARHIAGLVVCIQLIGGIALYLAWKDRVPDAAAMAAFHAISSFCNAGFEIFSGAPGHTGGLPLDTVSMSIIGTLGILGAIGIPVLFELTSRRTRLSLHSRLTLVTVGALLVWGTFGLMLSETRGNLAGLPLWRQIELAAFQSAVSRSTGFAGLPFFESMQPASQLLLVTLMFIGGAPASMGGGITTGTFVTLVLALFAYVRGRSTPIVGGRAIPGEMVRKAASVLTISLFAVLTATWLLLLTHDVTLDRAVFEVVSAFSTCGLSLAFTTELNGFGQGVIMAMMAWGRLGALTVLALLTRREIARRVSYPEERILIG